MVRWFALVLLLSVSSAQAALIRLEFTGTAALPQPVPGVSGPTGTVPIKLVFDYDNTGLGYALGGGDYGYEGFGQSVRLQLPGVDLTGPTTYSRLYVTDHGQVLFDAAFQLPGTHHPSSFLLNIFGVGNAVANGWSLATLHHKLVTAPSFTDEIYLPVSDTLNREINASFTGITYSILPEPAAVPAPSVLALLGIGLVALRSRRRCASA